MESTEDAPVPHVDLPAVQQFVVRAETGPSAPREWQSEGARCAIGSDPLNDIVLEDRTVSRFHCEIQIDLRRGLTIRDLGSRNRTYVDGVDVVEARLRDGSVLRLGNTTLSVRLSEAHNPLPISSAECFGRLVGKSLAMRIAFFRLERAASSDSTLLIEGETGTGKDLAAESVHMLSGRKEAPFVVVDCGSIPTALMESAILGHVRGSFTGAIADKVGAFEAAQGGTVFLDEIGELPLDLQPKLLRVLDKRTVQPVGSTERRPVDVRVIAATNRDLRAAVNDGSFRADLYYRLSVVSVRMPPLRERPEDLPDLVKVILEDLGTKPAQRDAFLSGGFLQRVVRAAWPGNVRELRNYVEHALVMATAASAISEPVGVATIPPPPRVPPNLDESYESYKRRAGEQADREYLTTLLRQHRSNVAKAAETARISRTHLYRLMQRLKVHHQER